MKRIFSGILALTLVLLMVPLSVSGEDPSFSASLAADNKPVDVGGTAYVGISIASTPQGAAYNTYSFTLQYDADKLAFGTASIGNMTPEVVKDVGGTLTVAGYGEEKNTTMLTLTFTVKAAGAAQIKLTAAGVDVCKNAGGDIKPATITTSAVTVMGGGYPVTLPKGVTGAAYVAANGDYTFAPAPGYSYTFKATVDGNPAEVIDNKDGTYTVKKVTGPLVITAEGSGTAVTYDVTVEGSGASDVTAAAKATHGQEYSFTIKKDAVYEYSVSVTVGGQPVTCTESDGTYTIAGELVTGPVVITVARVATAATTWIQFTGNGVEDLWDGYQSCAVKNGEDYAFCFDPVSGYDYTVKAESAGEEIGLTLFSMGSYEKYTIPGSAITGGIITVTITKTERLATKVTVTEYVKQDKMAIWLVQATTENPLPITKSLYYGDQPMFWSQAYGSGAYVWLVKSAEQKAQVQAAAEAAISARQSMATTLVYSCDVNNSGTVDINDAQYVYNVYNHIFTDISTKGDIEKFLRCDVSPDGKIDTTDAAAVVDRLLK